MISMNTPAQNTNNPEKLQMLGYGLLNISKINNRGKFSIILQRGIGVPLIQNVI